MPDDPKTETITIERDHLAKLQKELDDLRSGSERDRSRAALLEERVKREAVDSARRRIFAESVGRRNVPLDVSRALVLLERLTADVAAQVGDDGLAFVPGDQELRIREQADAIVHSLNIQPAGPPVPPPITPGEPPTRTGRGSPPAFTNSWNLPARKTGTAKGRDMIAAAARELEREGKI